MTAIDRSARLRQKWEDYQRDPDLAAAWVRGILADALALLDNWDEVRAAVARAEALDPIMWPDPPGRYGSMEATRAFRDGTQAQHDATRRAITGEA